MHVDMVAQFLVPGVEHLDDPGCAPRYFLSADSSRSVCAQHLCEQPVKKLLVTEEQGVEFVREQ